MIETASWPSKCATDSSGRRAQDSRPAPAASASPFPHQAIQHRARLRTPGAAAQTRMVSVARIRLGSWESARAFKRIICDDVSEFESYTPSHAVGSLWRVYPVHGLQRWQG